VLTFCQSTVQAKAAAATKVTEGAAPRGKNANHERPAEPQRAKTSSLPANFFDSQGVKRPNDGENAKMLPLPQLNDS
jgi:zinc finger protein 830